MDSAVVIISAILLNAAIGGFSRFYRRIGIGWLAWLPAAFLRAVERKLNRETRSVEKRRSRGIGIVAVMMLASLLAGIALERLFAYNIRFLEILLLASMLPVRPTWNRAAGIYKALKAGDNTRAHAWLEKTIWRHHGLLDSYGVARAGIEMLAVHFSEKIMAPACYYVVFGMPGFLLSKMACLQKENLVHTVQVKQGVSKGFGEAAYWVHYLLHYLPARVAALLWLAAMLFLPSGKPLDATHHIINGDIDRAAPEEVSVLAAASVLGLALGGPTSAYTGEAWLGGGRAKAVPADMRSALYLFALLHLFLVILFGFFI